MFSVGDHLMHKVLILGLIVLSGLLHVHIGMPEFTNEDFSACLA